MKVDEILKYLEQRFPYELASPFDKGKIGLVIGSKDMNVNGVMCSLDVTIEVVNDAVKNNCNLIITHHPFLFNAITKIDPNDDKGMVIYQLIKNDIALISMHTNMDLGFNGVADTLANLYNLKNANTGQNDCFVRYGDIEKTSFKDLILKTKKLFSLNGVRYVGDLDKQIKRIAIVGGSGGQEEEMMVAIDNQCDCYITGELKHHLAIFAKHYNLCLIEINHGIEKVVFNDLLRDLHQQFSEVTFIYSNYDTDLFKFL